MAALRFCRLPRPRPGGPCHRRVTGVPAWDARSWAARLVAVLAGLLSAARPVPLMAAAEPAQPTVHQTAVQRNPDAITCDDAVRKSALELGAGGNIQEAIQKLRSLYRKCRTLNLLLDLMDLHRRAGDAQDLMATMLEYERENPHPSATVREQLSNHRSWALQAMNGRSAGSPLGVRKSAPSEIAPSARRPRAVASPRPAERLLYYGPPDPGTEKSGPPAGPALLLSLLAVPKPAPRPPRRMPRWGWAVLGVVLGGTAVAVGVGVGTYLNPQRNYPVYPSRVSP